MDHGEPLQQEYPKRGSARERPRNAESDVVDHERRVAAPAHGRPAAPVLVAPSAATEYAAGAVDVGIVDVPAPFPRVAQHVVQTPGVGLLTADLMNPLLRIAAVPGDVVKKSVARSGRPGAAGMLPFRFGRQPVAVRGCVPLDTLAVVTKALRGRHILELGQRVAESDRVEPRD